MKRIFCFGLLALFFFQSAQAQLLLSFSDNSRYMAALYFDKNEIRTKDVLQNGKLVSQETTYSRYNVKVYSLQSKNLVKQIDIIYDGEDAPQQMYLSPDAKTLYVKFTRKYFIYNVRTGNLLMDYVNVRHNSFDAKTLKKLNEFYKDEKIIAFPHFDDSYLVANNGKIKQYDANFGMQRMIYKGVSGSAFLKEFYFTPNDKYFVIKDERKRISIWETGNEKLRKRSAGDDSHFSEDGKYFYLFRLSGTVLYAYTYELPSFTRISKISSKKVLAAIVQQRDERLGKTKSRSYRPAPINIDVSLSALSPCGQFSALAYENENIFRIAVIDNHSSHVYSEYSYNIEIEKPMAVKWINDSTIFIQNSVLNGEFWNFWTNEQSPIKLTFDEVTKYSEKKQVKKIVHSNDMALSVLAQSKVNLAVKSNTIGNEYLLPNVFFKDYTLNNEMIIATDLLNNLGYLPREVLGEDGVDLKYFSDSVVEVKESIIGPDRLPPAGFKYNRIDEFKNIGKAKERGLPLEFELKSVHTDDSLVTLNVHLMDSAGTYYYGATEEGWERLWCKFLVKKPGGEVAYVKDVRIEEHNSFNPQPAAFAMVMDHSGSMGPDRALVLQNGAAAFIDEISDEDAMAIVKYDNGIGIESYLTKDKKELKANLKHEALLGYGGATALLDAINSGISILKDDKLYKHKHIVILTDGGENSSFIAKNEVVKRAVENDIKVFTIGFGDYVNDDYLQAIADYTGGSYYKIYNTEDLTWIFNDIYLKINNYYSVTFPVDSIGDYSVIIKLCHDDVESDSLVVDFNSKKKDVYTLTEEDVENHAYVSKINKSDTLKFDYPQEEYFTDISFIKIQETDSIKVVDKDPSVIDYAFILTEFNTIKLPNIKFEFDKTVIVKGTDKELPSVVAFMKKYPEVSLEIVGHTDGIGSLEYNMDLSVRRANAIKELMVKMGIAEDRIETSAKGEIDPIEDNSNTDGRAQNRRVEFLLMAE